jgi:GNAT superfamily N-acetyltransferase
VGDAPRIAAIYCASATEAVAREPSHFELPSEQAVAASYESTIRDEAADRAIFVAQVGGTVIGYVDVSIRRPLPRPSMLRPRVGGWVEELAVDQAFRRADVGRRLMARAEAWARELGAQILILDTGTANVDAQQFYRRIGYRAIGVVLIKEWDAKG